MPAPTRTPFRYPGGKSRMADMFEAAMRDLGVVGGILHEPFAGGAGLGCELLCRGVVGTLVLTEADPCVHAFWDALSRTGNELADRVSRLRPCPNEWHRFREVFRDGGSPMDMALAAIYLNRSNYCGILAANPMGGMSFGPDAFSRFSPEKIAARIRSLPGGRIVARHGDGVAAIRDVACDILFVDPPYMDKGKMLYREHMDGKAHERLDNVLKSMYIPWCLTIDGSPEAQAVYGRQDLCGRSWKGISPPAGSRKKARERIIVNHPALEKHLKGEKNEEKHEDRRNLPV